MMAIGFKIHVRDGRVRLYTITGADWSKRYPLIVEAAAKINGNAIVDAEVVWLDSYGVAQFDALHSRVNDAAATALAFDLLMHNGEDVRRKPFAERKAILRKTLQRTRRGIQYVEHTEGDGVEIFKAVCKLGLEGIVSKNLNAAYKSGPSKAWLKIKNPKAPGRQRESSMVHSEVKETKLVLVSARKSRGGVHWDKDDYVIGADQ
jgi:ATP-dependent DNA ligase